ncbi:MAG: ABC transporter permease [Halieaceae bacterium]|nr:ABC transporter permease [Halieaceae bacterium]
MFLNLASHSLWSRRGSVALTFLAITVSVFVLLGIEKIREQTRTSFSSTIAGTDLVVGARTGDINLLLYSVFRLGTPTNNIGWKSYQDILGAPEVAWAIPLSLGDSHRGYRVVGTTQDYFEHYRYGQSQPLRLADGQKFESMFDVVLGSTVARNLGYRLGDKLVLVHGIGQNSFSEHKNTPFQVSGILAATGTPVDKTLHISLQGLEAMHVGWNQGVNLTTAAAGVDQFSEQDLVPESITAVLVGLNSKLATFGFQRAINNYKREPLLAILPGVTLSQLWETMGAAEQALRLISVLVLVASLLGLAAMLLASIRERQHEVAVMRAMGASPRYLLALIEAEAVLITLASCLVATISLELVTLVAGQILGDETGLRIVPALPTTIQLGYLLAIIVGAMILSLIPAIAAYRQALHQSLA